MGKTRESLFIILATFYIVYMIVPIFRFIVGLDISVVCVATFAGLFILYPKVFINKTSFIGLIYLGILFIYYLMGKELPSFGAGEAPTLVRIIMAIAFVIPNLAIYYILKHLNSDKMYRYFCWMPLIVLVASFATYTHLIIGNRGVLRLITLSDGESSTNPLLPHYSLLHAYVFIMPALILAFKSIKNRTRYYFLFVAVYDFYVIVQSSITALLLLAIISIVFMLIYNENNSGKSLIRAFGFSLLFFLLIESGVMDAIMNTVVNMYADTASEGKMRMFRDILAGNELQTGNTLDEREGLHSISINAFFANPIFGSTPVSGHSSILDRLGGLGLFGFIPYVIFLYSVFKDVAKTYNTKIAKIGFYLVSFCVLLMLYQKGIFGQECWLFFIVIAPAILHYVENENQKKNISS